MSIKKVLITISLVAIAGAAWSQQSTTLSTYYLSPKGTYERLRLIPRASLLAQTACDIGTLYMDLDGGTPADPSDDNLLRFCKDDGDDGQWGDFGGGSGGVWSKTVDAGLDNYHLTEIADPQLKKVGIGTNSPEFKLTLEHDGGIIAKGEVDDADPDAATLLTSGAGTRLIWYPKKAAFRAGQVTGNQWDVGNIGYYSVAFGHDNMANFKYTSILGGSSNTTAVINHNFVGGGLNNLSSGDRAGVGGGRDNSATGDRSTVGGGRGNTATSFNSTVSGGLTNSAGGSFSTVSGGELNSSSSYASTVSGGYNNRAQGSNATISGGSGNTTNGTLGTISGGLNNATTDQYGTISGGASNVVDGEQSTISGGLSNYTGSYYNTIGGGRLNVAGVVGNVNTYSTIIGGQQNTASGYYAFIGGGQDNQATADYSAVLGGNANKTLGPYSFVGGGQFNEVSGSFSVISGGDHNTVSGDYSWAGGNRVTVSGDRSFAWGNNFTVSQDDAFVVGTGNVGIGVLNPVEKLHIDGNMRVDTGSITITPPYSTVGVPTNLEIDASGLVGQDLAEVFETSEQVSIGDVLIIDTAHTMKLKKSDTPYDEKVVGIVSGSPAMLFEGDKMKIAPEAFTFIEGQKPPVAISGRVPCKVSLENGPIHYGDLLTTSSLSGHAMKADDNRDKSFGKIVGKALESFDGGPNGETSGMIAVLVTLQ